MEYEFNAFTKLRVKIFIIILFSFKFIASTSLKLIGCIFILFLFSFSDFLF